MMRRSRTIVAQVNHLDTERGEDVCDETPVATPPEEFRTHHGGAESAREHEEVVEAERELLGADVIGIRPEGGMLPTSVDRGRVRTASAAEFWDPMVENLRTADVALESVGC